MIIDVEALRHDLIDYFGTAISYNPIAMADLVRVEAASDYEIVDIAIKNGFDISKYEVSNNKTR